MDEERKERVRVLKEISKIKTETQVWKFVNMERRKRSGISNKIKMEQWRGHFMQLLEGTECTGQEGRKKREEDGEELYEEEIEEQIKKLKKSKAAGSDGIANEAWIYSQGGIRTKLNELIKRVWRGEGLPEKWREGLISVIHKKGEEGNPANYRGITLLGTAYKIYAAILAENIRREVEEKQIIPETQFGFRQGRGTIDSIYVLHHVVRRELEKGGNVYGFSIDFRAAFDMLDRQTLWEAMERRGRRKGYVERIEE